MKRTFFIILSGFVAAAAVMLSSPKNQPQPPSPDAEFGTHNAVMKAFATEDGMLQRRLERAVNAALDTPANTPTQNTRPVSVKFISPQIPPDIAPDDPSAAAPVNHDTPKPASAWDKLATSNFTHARIFALANLATKQILEIPSGKPDEAKALLTHIASSTQNHGVYRHVVDFKMARLWWKCLNPERTQCILVDDVKALTLPTNFSCNAARQNVVQCGNEPLNSAHLFGTPSCDLGSNYPAFVKMTKNAPTGNGSFTIDKKTFDYRKNTTKSGCEITTIMPRDKAAPIPFPFPGYSPFYVILAVLSGFAFVMLGTICTRSPKTKKLSQPKTRENSQNLENSSEKYEIEIKKLTAQRDRFESQYHEKNQENNLLLEQLRHARSEYKKEQIIRMSLAEENQRLEDALAQTSSHTVIDSPVNYVAHTDQAQPPKLDIVHIDARKDDAHSSPKLENADTNDNSNDRTTRPATPLKESGEENSFLDAIDDDGWDEIADSFDAILSPKTPQQSPSHDIVTKSGMDILDNESPDTDDTFGMTGFLSAIKEQEKTPANPPGRSNTETSLKPVSDIPRLTPVPTPSAPGAPHISGLRGTTLPGVTTIEHNADSAESFRPAPSWTGKNVAPGLDDNSLLNALRKQAKDVSQMSLPAAPNTSGAFEFNRTLSKSGVFSLTGSRVDIAPASDNEYFRQVYEKFIQTQKECGESPNKFTLEQFVCRLAREKQALTQKFKCRDVQFSVYVKDGKASLKASPKK